MSKEDDIEEEKTVRCVKRMTRTEKRMEKDGKGIFMTV
jgi:hypothetical protein